MRSRASRSCVPKRILGTRRRDHSYPRSALTFIELLVVSAILGALLLIVLPAIQKIRATAQRLQCQNNLHQIGLAFQNYHEVLGCFPPAQVDDPRYFPKNKDKPPPYPWLSWRGYLMPFVDQEALWRTTQEAFKTNSSPFRDPPHTGLSTPVDVFLCPDDPHRRTTVAVARPDLVPPNVPAQGQAAVALTSYIGVNGTNLQKKDGTIIYNQEIKIPQIKDGTSHTIIVGERPASQPYAFGWWYAGAGQFYTLSLTSAVENLDLHISFNGIYTGSASQSLGATEINTQSSGYAAYDNCPAGPYQFGSGKVTNPCDAFHFWSLHPGGANFLFADGAVRFLSYNIGDQLVALATRAGGEILDE